MNAIEFEAKIHDGMVEIPAQYSAWQNKTVRVILLEPEDKMTTIQSSRFIATSLQTKNYHFNREQANER